MEWKGYVIVRKFRFKFFGKQFGFAWRRRTTLSKAVQFIFDKGIATLNSRVDDVRLMLELGMDFCSWDYDVKRVK